MKLPTPFQGMKVIKSLVLRAQELAAEMGDAATGAEHLLLAAFELPEGSARRAFERAGADPDRFTGAVADSHDAALRTLGVEPIDAELLGPSGRGPTRVGESAAHVLRSAATRSRANRTETIGAQVVAAVAELHHGTAARALRQMDVDRNELAIAADAEIASTLLASGNTR